MGGEILDEELKPCLCGGKAKLNIRERKFYGWRGDGTKVKDFFVQVICNRCHSRGGLIATKKKGNSLEEVVTNEERRAAIDAWNRRIGDA